MLPNLDIVCVLVLTTANVYVLTAPIYLLLLCVILALFEVFFFLATKQKPNKIRQQPCSRLIT